MKILAYTTPARGHLYPLVPILDELARRGHGIAVRTLSSEVDLMRDRGFAAAPIAPAIEAIQHDDHLARTPPAKLKRGMATFNARAPRELGDVQSAIDEEQPDAMLIDCMTWGASAVAQTQERPWAQWFPYPLPLTSPDVPPFGPGLEPGSGPLAHARDSVVRRLGTKLMESAVLPALNETRRRAGAPPFGTIDEMYTTPPLVLYMTAEPFEYPRSDWPASIRMVGACAWDPPVEPPAWLDEVERPLVLVSTSSEFQDDGKLARVALEALAAEPVEVVATLPSAHMPDTVPANARVERFIPHAPILARAACAITHGGAGATQKALAAGVPVTVVPFGRDQMEVARRVEVAGAGTRLPVGRLSPERLRARVREAMGMAAGARRVAHGFAATGGAVAAATAFEAHAGTREPAAL